MSLPASVNINNLTGKYTLNSKLSDNPDPIFEVQGLSWIARKAIGVAPMGVNIITHTVDGSGIGHLEIESSAAGKKSLEKRDLDGKVQEYESQEFKVPRKTKSDFVPFSSIDDEFLKSNWDASVTGDKVIHTWTYSPVGDWTLEQTWGLQKIKGERYFVKQLVVRKSDKTKTARLVHGYVS